MIKNAILILCVLTLVLIMYILFTTCKNIERFNADHKADDVFVYYLDFKEYVHNKYDGSTMRHLRGVSGTHTSAIVVMEQLKVHYPDVDCYIVDPMANERIFNGVNYTSDLTRLSDATLLITSVQMSADKFSIEKMPNLKAFVLVSHLFNIGPDLKEFVHKNIKVGMVFFNQWCEKYVRDNDSENKLKLIKHKAYIPNPLVSDCLPTMNRDDLVADMSFQFYASYERGGALADKVICEIPKSRLSILSYADNNVVSACGHEFIGSKGKIDVFENMTRTRCFLYPLVLPNGRFHKDMAPLCVTEALACGVRVMTYPQGAMHELFGDLCDWLPAQSPEVLDKIKNTNFHVDLSELNSPENIRDLTRFVNESLEDDDRDRRMRTAEAIRLEFGAKKIGEDWSAFVKEMIE